MLNKGKRFLNEFINLREINVSEFSFKIKEFLIKYKVNWNEDWVAGGLLTEFFGCSWVLQINPNATKHVVIGKGVLYDSGGYSLKHSQHMKDMFFDRNGALLTVAHCINTGDSGIIFLANNMLNNHIVPGMILNDIFNKEKVLIDNTDAEGRIGLAHCLGLANKLGYKKALTIATLTGAAVQVTSERVAALVHSNEPKDLIKVMSARVDKKLQLHPAPYNKVFDRAVNSSVIGATITNLSNRDGAGSSTAFSFLKRFFKGHLIHLDMAAMMKTANGNGLVWGLKEVKFLTSLLR